MTEERLKQIETHHRTVREPCMAVGELIVEVRRLRAGLESLKVRCDCPGGACTCGAWRNVRIAAILEGEG